MTSRNAQKLQYSDAAANVDNAMINHKHHHRHHHESISVYPTQVEYNAEEPQRLPAKHKHRHEHKVNVDGVYDVQNHPIQSISGLLKNVRHHGRKPKTYNYGDQKVSNNNAAVNTVDFCENCYLPKLSESGENIKNDTLDNVVNTSKHVQTSKTKLKQKRVKGEEEKNYHSKSTISRNIVGKSKKEIYIITGEDTLFKFTTLSQEKVHTKHKRHSDNKEQLPIDGKLETSKPGIEQNSQDSMRLMPNCSSELIKTQTINLISKDKNLPIQDKTSIIEQKTRPSHESCLKSNEIIGTHEVTRQSYGKHSERHSNQPESDLKKRKDKSDYPKVVSTKFKHRQKKSDITLTDRTKSSEERLQKRHKREQRHKHLRNNDFASPLENVCDGKLPDSKDITALLNKPNLDLSNDELEYRRKKILDNIEKAYSKHKHILPKEVVEALDGNIKQWRSMDMEASKKSSDQTSNVLDLEEVLKKNKKSKLYFREHHSEKITTTASESTLPSGLKKTTKPQNDLILLNAIVTGINNIDCDKDTVHVNKIPKFVRLEEIECEPDTMTSKRVLSKISVMQKCVSDSKGPFDKYSVQGAIPKTNRVVHNTVSSNEDVRKEVSFSELNVQPDVSLYSVKNQKGNCLNRCLPSILRNKIISKSKRRNISTEKNLLNLFMKMEARDLNKLSRISIDPIVTFANEDSMFSVEGVEPPKKHKPNIPAALVTRQNTPKLEQVALPVLQITSCFEKAQSVNDAALSTSTTELKKSSPYVRKKENHRIQKTPGLSASSSESTVHLKNLPDDRFKTQPVFEKPKLDPKKPFMTDKEAIEALKYLPLHQKECSECSSRLWSNKKKLKKIILSTVEIRSEIPAENERMKKQLNESVYKSVNKLDAKTKAQIPFKETGFSKKPNPNFDRADDVILPLGNLVNEKSLEDYVTKDKCDQKKYDKKGSHIPCLNLNASRKSTQSICSSVDDRSQSKAPIKTAVDGHRVRARMLSYAKNIEQRRKYSRGSTGSSRDTSNEGDQQTFTYVFTDVKDETKKHSPSLSAISITSCGSANSESDKQSEKAKKSIKQCCPKNDTTITKETKNSLVQPAPIERVNPASDTISAALTKITEETISQDTLNGSDFSQYSKKEHESKLPKLKHRYDRSPITDRFARSNSWAEKFSPKENVTHLKKIEASSIRSGRIPRHVDLISLKKRGDRSSERKGDVSDCESIKSSKSRKSDRTNYSFGSAKILENKNFGFRKRKPATSLKTSSLRGYSTESQKSDTLSNVPSYSGVKNSKTKTASKLSRSIPRSVPNKNSNSNDKPLSAPSGFDRNKMYSKVKSITPSMDSDTRTSLLSTRVGSAKESSRQSVPLPTTTISKFERRKQYSESLRKKMKNDNSASVNNRVCIPAKVRDNVLTVLEQIDKKTVVEVDSHVCNYTDQVPSTGLLEAQENYNVNQATSVCDPMNNEQSNQNVPEANFDQVPVNIDIGLSVPTFIRSVKSETQLNQQPSNYVEETVPKESENIYQTFTNKEPENDFRVLEKVSKRNVADGKPIEIKNESGLAVSYQICDSTPEIIYSTNANSITQLNELSRMKINILEACHHLCKHDKTKPKYILYSPYTCSRKNPKLIEKDCSLPATFHKYIDTNLHRCKHKCNIHSMLKINRTADDFCHWYCRPRKFFSNIKCININSCSNINNEKQNLPPKPPRFVQRSDHNSKGNYVVFKIDKNFELKKQNHNSPRNASRECFKIFMNDKMQWDSDYTFRFSKYDFKSKFFYDSNYYVNQRPVSETGESGYDSGDAKKSRNLLRSLSESIDVSKNSYSTVITFPFNVNESNKLDDLNLSQILSPERDNEVVICNSQTEQLLCESVTNRCTCSNPITFDPSIRPNCTGYESAKRLSSPVQTLETRQNKSESHCGARAHTSKNENFLYTNRSSSYKPFEENKIIKNQSMLVNCKNTQTFDIKPQQTNVPYQKKPCRKSRVQTDDSDTSKNYDNKHVQASIKRKHKRIPPEFTSRSTSYESIVTNDDVSIPNNTFNRNELLETLLSNPEFLELITATIKNILVDTKVLSTHSSEEIIKSLVQESILSMRKKPIQVVNPSTIIDKSNVSEENSKFSIEVVEKNAKDLQLQLTTKFMAEHRGSRIFEEFINDLLMNIIKESFKLLVEKELKNKTEELPKTEEKSTSITSFSRKPEYQLPRKDSSLFQRGKLSASHESLHSETKPLTVEEKKSLINDLKSFETSLTNLSRSIRETSSNERVQQYCSLKSSNWKLIHKTTLKPSASASATNAKKICECTTSEELESTELLKIMAKLPLTTLMNLYKKVSDSNDPEVTFESLIRKVYEAKAFREDTEDKQKSVLSNDSTVTVTKVKQLNQSERYQTTPLEKSGKKEKKLTRESKARKLSYYDDQRVRNSLGSSGREKISKKDVLNLSNKQIFTKLLDSFEKEEAMIRELSTDGDFLNSQLETAKNKKSVECLLRQPKTPDNDKSFEDVAEELEDIVEEAESNIKFNKYEKKTASRFSSIKTKMTRLFKSSSRDLRGTVSGSHSNRQSSVDEFIGKDGRIHLSKSKAVERYKRDETSLSSDDSNYVKPHEIGKYFMRGFREDQMLLSGASTSKSNDQRAIRDDTSLESFVELSEKDNALDYLLALGYSIEEASRAIKDEDVENRLNAAIIEARIWVNQVTSTQGTLLYLLAYKAKPKIMRYYLQLIEAIINNRINNAVKLDSFLKVLEKVEDGEISMLYVLGSDIFHEEENEEYLLKKQLRKIFHDVYRVAENEAKIRGKELTKNEINLLKVLSAKYRSGLPEHLEIIAQYIGSGLLKSQVQLEGIIHLLSPSPSLFCCPLSAAMIYFSRLDSPEYHVSKFEKYCGIK
ncbi:hypothetical protein FQR65_LT03431 [Abscondita terminalis]|nr:hypothetical protein FQR65_LT03431 [Abscondita terminalis]